MKIRIYKLTQGSHKTKFGSVIVLDNSTYKLMYEGNLNCSFLKEIYATFNLNPLFEHNGITLSIGDVVEVCGDVPTVVGCIRFYTSPTSYKEIDYVDIETFNNHILEARELRMSIETLDLSDKHITTVEKGYYRFDGYGFKQINQ